MKPCIKTLSLPLFIFSLVGCSSFPDSGTGGMAEHNQYEKELGYLTEHQSNSENTEIQYSVEPNGELESQHGLRFDMELLQRHLDALILEGAELCFPATVVQAKQREKRIVRQLRGKLIYDAANDIIIQRGLLGRLEKQLDYVKANNVCVLPTVTHSISQEKPGDFALEIFNLLNSDNQFATNSSEINPKYVIRLSKATELLKKIPNYKLKITGHTDTVGSDEFNQNLSLKRAQQVQRYLQILGIPLHNMEVSAIGKQEPLFQGEEPQVRLVNRRVSIEILELQDSSMIGENK